MTTPIASHALVPIERKITIQAPTDPGPHKGDEGKSGIRDAPSDSDNERRDGEDDQQKHEIDDFGAVGRGCSHREDQFRAPQVLAGFTDQPGMFTSLVE